MIFESKWDLLSNLVHEAIRRLEKKNITHAEAFFTSTHGTEAGIRNSEILTQNRFDDCGVGFRVAVAGNKVGFACTNILSEKAVFEACEKAFAIAQVSSEISGFALPEEGKQTKVDGLFSSQFDEISSDLAVDVAKRMIKSAEDFDKRVIAKDGRVRFESGSRGIVNTLGVDLEEKESRSIIYLGASGKQDGEVTGSCYDFMLSRTADVEPEEVGENVGKMVVEMFRAKTVKSFQGPVIFGPDAVADQLLLVLVDALKGENVIAGRSAWGTKLDHVVTSENVTMCDNAVLEGGFASRSFDDEGFPSQKTVVLEKGILKSFLHNATSANSLKARNTGNASRFAGGFELTRWLIGSGYRAKPEVYPSNFTIRPGDKTKEELITKIGKGVLVESMAGFAQPGSGVISAQLSRAFLIENGEIKHPLKGAMISGVGFDWFKRISGIGKDSKKFVNAIVPCLRVEDVKVVGT